MVTPSRCDRYASTAAAISMEPMPPIHRLDRAPATPANQPISGAKIGVEPWKISTYSAITRPRYASLTPSWTRWLAACAR